MTRETVDTPAPIRGRRMHDVRVILAGRYGLERVDKVNAGAYIVHTVRGGAWSVRELEDGRWMAELEEGGR